MASGAAARRTERERTEASGETEAAAPKADKKKQVRAILVNVARNVSIQATPTDMLQLKPGWNFVAEHLWDKAKDNEQVVALQNTKIPKARSPEEMSAKVGQPHLVVGKCVDKDNPLRTMDVDEALQFVGETLVVPTLKKLEEQEDRPEILRAIRGQVETIEQPKKAARRARESTED